MACRLGKHRHGPRGGEGSLPTLGMERNGIFPGLPCPRWAGFGGEVRSFVGCLEVEVTVDVDPIPLIYVWLLYHHSCIPRVKKAFARREIRGIATVIHYKRWSQQQVTSRK